MTSPTRFLFLLVPEFSHLAFSCAVEPLRIANLVSGQELYQWSFASEDGQQAVCSNGSVTLVHCGLDALPACEHLFVLSGIHVADHITPALLATLRRAVRSPAQIGALCSGAYILARAGMLDGMKAAIHWEFHDGFMEEFPNVNLRRNVFVADAPIVTASGGTATADLMLHLIEQAHGADLAVAVSDQMVYNAVRASTAEQRVSLQSRHGMRNPHLARAIRIMQDNIEYPGSPADIAASLEISVRQLERLFGRYLNCSPKKYYVEMRLERARHLLIQTDHAISEVAFATGFESAGHFSRVYKATYGISPSHQRVKIT